ncbi:hypothetical protein GS506_25480 [Rhodococcus hoagii]|nr:hypothetical protein [Prescottella equi]
MQLHLQQQRVHLCPQSLARTSLRPPRSLRGTQPPHRTQSVCAQQQKQQPPHPWPGVDTDNSFGRHSRHSSRGHGSQLRTVAFVFRALELQAFDFGSCDHRKPAPAAKHQQRRTTCLPRHAEYRTRPAPCPADWQ